METGSNQREEFVSRKYERRFLKPRSRVGACVKAVRVFSFLPSGGGKTPLARNFNEKTESVGYGLNELCSSSPLSDTIVVMHSSVVANAKTTGQSCSARALYSAYNLNIIPTTVISDHDTFKLRVLCILIVPGVVPARWLSRLLHLPQSWELMFL